MEYDFNLAEKQITLCIIKNSTEEHINSILKTYRSTIIDQCIDIVRAHSTIDDYSAWMIKDMEALK